MSGGAEVRLLRQDAGQESPRMPAWKREILERRKAKGGGSGGTGSPETSPGSAGPQRVNGELTGNVNGSGGLTRDGGAAGGSGRNYTITTASQHFANNKEPRPTASDRTPRENDRHESLVLQESLGPLEENPFIKLEKERRRRQERQEREHTGRPVQHILELYGSVPGIRTIRADNIIIIESDPDYFPEAGDAQTGAKWQHNGVGGYSSLNDLLDRRGSAVTEIRAKEVVIYDTTLSKSEENLSTLGRPEYEAAYAAGEGHGRVSRILQKFDSNYGKLQKKSHSTENLLDLDSNSSSRSRLWSRPQPDLGPKQGPGQSVSSQLSSPLFQSSCSSTPKHPVPEHSSPQHIPGGPHPVSSFRQRFEEGPAAPPRDEPDRGPNKLTRERDWEVTEVSPKPKVPCSPETRRARAESPTAPFSFKASRPSQDFEIRPSPKPDLAQIPDGDTQARALANLRLQSRNSFTVVPKGRLTAPPAAASTVKAPSSNRVPPSPTLPVKSTEKKAENLLEENEMERLVGTPKPDASPSTETSPGSPVTSDLLSPPAVVTPPPSSSPAPASPPSSPAPADSPAPLPLTSTPSPTHRPPSMDQLPVTNIDDIEVEPPQRVPVPSPLVQRKKGNTFTVVPKRRVEADTQPSSPETQPEAPRGAPPGSTPPQAPYAQLGTLLKKRYPAVEDIQVIGGYLSLPKSCLSKTGSSGKKLKISFNESSLHSTYEYPSESSVWDSGDEEEEEQEEEPPSMVGRIHIPRPSIITTPTHSNSSSSSDLSSYVPKHSVDFSSWQEHKHDDGVHQVDADAQTTAEVMLTPADSSSLSDYSSEPALYF
uniref:Taperin n=1 Tax=Oryzias sinensis TaxID=183150 RepID=A0A8C7ZUI3_9TELE